MLSVALGAFAGCEGAPLTKSGGADGSAGGGGAPSDAGAILSDGTKVWSADATKVVLESFGDGFGPAPSDADPCVRGATYTVTIGDRKLAWDVCNIVGADPSKAHDVGERVLSTTELDGVVRALDMVAVSHGHGCGADKGTETLTITNPAGTREFFDDFYACLAIPGQTYVSNIDAVSTALYALAK